jgi:hypothetical protein
VHRGLNDSRNGERTRRIDPAWPPESSIVIDLHTALAILRSSPANSPNWMHNPFLAHDSRFVLPCSSSFRAQGGNQLGYAATLQRAPKRCIKSVI